MYFPTDKARVPSLLNLQQLQQSRDEFKKRINLEIDIYFDSLVAIVQTQLQANKDNKENDNLCSRCRRQLEEEDSCQCPVNNEVTSENEYDIGSNEEAQWRSPAPDSEPLPGPPNSFHADEQQTTTGSFVMKAPKWASEQSIYDKSVADESKSTTEYTDWEQTVREQIAVGQNVNVIDPRERAQHRNRKYGPKSKKKLIYKIRRLDCYMQGCNERFYFSNNAPSCHKQLEMHIENKHKMCHWQCKLEGCKGVSYKTK